MSDGLEDTAVVDNHDNHKDLEALSSEDKEARVRDGTAWQDNFGVYTPSPYPPPAVVPFPCPNDEACTMDSRACPAHTADVMLVRLIGDAVAEDNNRVLIPYGSNECGLWYKMCISEAIGVPTSSLTFIYAGVVFSDMRRYSTLQRESSPVCKVDVGG